MASSAACCMMTVRTSSLRNVILALACGIALTAGRAGTAAGAAAAPANCDAEAAALAQAESELPRLDVASPDDRPPYCITLETIIAFASRLQTHVARCRNSSFAPSAAEWDKTRTDYRKLFAQTRCKRAIFN
jgi:hypothetical protein